MENWITIALPKGRLGKQVYTILEAADFECPDMKENSRKLIFENQKLHLRYFWAKPSDVAIYVERGAADLGIVGKDILMEYRPNVYELLDLNMGKCFLAVAGRRDFEDNSMKTLRVATKFEHVAKNFYANQGREIDVIHLNGSIEIAPILGLSDCIVDIVESGKTLVENDLEVKEKICEVSARLIANRAGYAFKKEVIDRIVAGLGNRIEE